jgi:K+-sensing histidine kinase KdpD
VSDELFRSEVWLPALEKYVLSHELRAPRASIVGWAGVLRKSERPEHVRRAAETIERNAQLQSRMVEDLLDVNRIAHGTLGLELRRLEVISCVRAAIEILAQPIEQKSLRVDVIDTSEPLIVEADAGRLQQVFRNIISNAVKFTPEGGSSSASRSAARQSTPKWWSPMQVSGFHRNFCRSSSTSSASRSAALADHTKGLVLVSRW